MILNVDFALKLNNYAPLKRFICLKLILKNSPQYYILRSTYHKLPVTPFNVTVVNRTLEGHLELRLETLNNTNKSN